MRTLILIIVSLLCGRLQSQTIQNWKKLDYGPTPFQPFSVAETDDEVFAVAYNKLFKADDPLGNSWSEVTGLPENYNVDFIKTSSELLVVMLNQNKHEISGFLVFEMYVSDDNGESFTHVRTLTHRVYGRDSRINVTGKIITYSDGEDTFRGDLRSYISYDSGRTWENLTDYDLLFLTESEP